MKKNLNKLATLALSGMMVMSMAMPAFAAPPAPTFDTVSTFPKVVHTDGKTLAPSTTFEFEVKALPAEGKHTYKVKENNGQEVEKTEETKAGIDGALQLSPVTFKPDADNLGTPDEAPNKGAHFQEDSQVKINKEAFKGKDNGVYVYKLTEKNSGYEGVIYSKAEYKVYVFKYQDDAGNDKFATEFVAVKDAKNNPICQKVTQINNNYGKHNPPDNPDTPPVTPPGDNPNDTTHDVEITKKIIKGGYANMQEKFDFYVTIKPTEKKALQKDRDGKEIPEMYHVEPVSKKADYALGFKALTADVESAAFKVSHEDGIHIYGLTVGDEVIIREGKNEYVMTVKNASDTDKTYLSPIANAPAVGPNGEDLGNKGTFTLVNDGAKVEVENKKPYIAPTGLVMNVAPYALMLAVAGGMGVVFVNRKKEEE